MKKLDILDEHIITQYGCYKRVRRWLRGKHPELGKLTMGLTGLETIQEIDVIKPTHTFKVED